MIFFVMFEKEANSTSNEARPGGRKGKKEVEQRMMSIPGEKPNNTSAVPN